MNVELLAPAGSIESFYAAVNSGADSAYLGGKFFNARHFSQNFDNEEMKHIVKYAHNKGVKVYVTMNTVLKDNEITDALNYAIFLYENDVDSLIVQDLGLLYLINKYIPDFPVNISTQAAVYDEYGVKFFEELNVKKVIMARELSIQELKEAAKNTGTDLEVFIHGALCTCYSGQCYMSSFLGGRSAQDRPKLRNENFLIAQAVTNRAVAKKRIIFFPYSEIRDFLVAAYVESTYYYLPALIAFGSFPVNAGLCFFVWQGITRKIYLLCAEKAHAFRPIFNGIADI